MAPLAGGPHKLQCCYWWWGGGGWFCGAGLPWMQVGSLLRVSGPPPEGLWLAGSPVLL